MLGALLLNQLGHGLDVDGADAAVHLDVEPVEHQHQLANQAVHTGQVKGDRVQLGKGHVAHALEAEKVDNLEQLGRQEADNQVAHAALEADASLKVFLGQLAFPVGALLVDRVTLAASEKINRN